MIELMYIRILTEMSVNRFKWTGLPEEIDKRFMEIAIFRNRFVLFYFDKRFGKYLALRATAGGRINAYDNPTSFMTVGPNFPTVRVYPGFSTKVAGKGIPIWGNALRMSDMDIVNIYAKKLAILDRTIEINSENARQNKIVKGHQRNSLSMSNLTRAAEGGSNYLEVGGALSDLEFIDVLDLAIDANMIDKLHILKVRLWNEVMGLLGIDNSNQDKKERLVEAEVGANDGQTDSMRHVSLNARRFACEQINRIYPDLEVWVDFNSEVQKRISLPSFAIDALEDEGYENVDTSTEEGGEEADNGDLYDADEERN